MNEVSKLSLHPMELLNSEAVTSIEKNNLQIQRDKINQLIKDNYIVFISNVNHLDESQIICLGETHDNEMHRKINAQIIDMLYIDESILLVEKTSQETNEKSNLLYEDDLTNEQAKYVKKPIKIQDWDIKEDENRKKEIEEFVIASMIYEKPEVTHFLSLSKMNKLVNDLDNNQLSTCSRITKIFSFCFTVCCTYFFIKSCTPFIKKYYKNKAYQCLQQMINDVPIRNQKMCESIKNVLETHKKVFVIGGSNHFDFMEQEVEGIDCRQANKAIEQTIDFLATTKFAILIPKSE